MRGTFPRQVGLLDLIAEIEAGRLALPEFQREFEWQDDRVEALLTTLLKGWPAGSLLFLEATDSLFFRPRRFHGGPPVSESRFRGTIVLDGQQRLTSIYHALTGAGESVFAIAVPLKTPLKTEVDDVEDMVVSYTRRQWQRLARGGAPVVIDESLVVPFTALRTISGVYEWFDSTAERLRDEHPDVGTRLRDLYRLLLENLHSYAFPAVFVDSEVAPAAVARIFERVNRNSEPLSTFDLLVAKTFREGWNMREQWDAACSETPILEAFFGKSGVVVAETISLGSPRPSVRKSDVLDLDSGRIRQEWDKGVEAVRYVLHRLERDCGCNGPSLLTYGALVPLYGALAARDVRLLGDGYDLRRHFMLTSLALRFDAAANTRVVEEFQALCHGGVQTKDGRAAGISALTLTEATRQSHGAIYRAVVALLTHRVNHGRLEPFGDLVPVSLWPRTDDSNLHLRAGSVAVVPREASPAAAKLGLAHWLRSGQLDGFVGLGAALEEQLLPMDELMAGGVEEALHQRRVDMLLRHLETEYAAVVEE